VLIFKSGSCWFSRLPARLGLLHWQRWFFGQYIDGCTNCAPSMGMLQRWTLCPLLAREWITRPPKQRLFHLRSLWHQAL